ncbi:unnamed protein product [Oncorhynchus mykiss]|uniref:Cystine/glutamate transporter n=1 Tax=Oncorhynchus mykiss TaxID=8022 RepID=A0A060XSJ8_ONCMY|nr:unnamed protein product [Oncorhynchus mykiss]
MTRRSVNGEGTGVNNTPQNGGHPGDTPAPKEEPDAPSGKVELRKKVTLLQGISIIIGTIIGAGIFISPKGILKNSGSVGMSLVVWIVCGVLSLFGALSYAELGTSIQKSGGHYTYILEAFGPQMAFIRLWADLIAIRPAGLAVISLAFGQYILEPIFMPCGVPEIAIKLATSIGITSVMYLNSMSTSWTNRIQIFLTFSKLLAIAIIIVPGLYMLFKGKPSNIKNRYQYFIIIYLLKLLSRHVHMFMEYSRWPKQSDVSKTAKILSEMSRISEALFSIVSLYGCECTTNEPALSVVSSRCLQHCDVFTFAGKMMGNFSVAVPVFVALSCFGSMNGCLFAFSRMFYVASREGHLPEVLSMIHVRRHTPLAAVLVLYPMTVFQLFVGDIYSLLNFMSFLRWLFIGVAVLGLIYMRYTRPDMPRPFKVPLFIPAIFSFTCFFMVFLSLYSDPVNTGIGFAISLTGIPAYYIFIVFDRRPKWLQDGLDSFNRSVQIILEVIPAEH